MVGGVVLRHKDSSREFAGRWCRFFGIAEQGVAWFAARPLQYVDIDLKPEPGSNAGCAADVHIAVHQLRQILHDRESESTAAKKAGDCAVGLAEGLKQQGQLRFSDAGATVGHCKFQSGAVANAAQLCGLNTNGSLVCKLDRIAQQVGQHLPQPIRVAQIGLVQGALPGGFKLQAFGRGSFCKQRLSVTDDRAPFKGD